MLLERGSLLLLYVEFFFFFLLCMKTHLLPPWQLKGGQRRNRQCCIEGPTLWVSSFLIYFFFEQKTNWAMRHLLKERERERKREREREKERETKEMWKKQHLSATRAFLLYSGGGSLYRPQSWIMQHRSQRQQNQHVGPGRRSLQHSQKENTSLSAPSEARRTILGIMAMVWRQKDLHWNMANIAKEK